MNKKEMQYKFRYIEQCNMCGSENYKVLGRRLNQSQGRDPKNKVGISTTVCKCKNCRLIYANPLPIPLNLQDHYGIPPEEYWTSEYFTYDENYFLKEITILKKLIGFREGMKALDVGAGLGKAMISLSKAGFDVYGFEPSKPFYERAISKMNIPPAKLKLGMLEEVEYEEESFDFITFGAVLEHLYDPSSSIKKALKWLKPRGIIQIEVPSSNWLIGKIINLYYRMKLSESVTNISPMHEPFHLYEFDIRSFREHAKLHGYEIAFHEYYVCDTYMPRLVDYFIRPLMKLTDGGMQLCVWIRKH